MSFAFNQSQQLSLFDATSNLTEREKHLLEKSWAKYFAEHIFPEIDEAPFAVLYSDRPSRHNTPVNVIIGALILKEIFGLTDEELVDTLPFDIRYQYALHTTSFEEQPLNGRTLGRFRARCNSYEELTGTDLIHDCIIKLSASMATLMKLNTGMRRMDSLMVASNIKKMSRLELLYTCVANLARLMKKSEDPSLPEALIHYTEDDDHNKVLYHNRSEDTDSKINQVLKDAALIISACGSRYDEQSQYQLLIRAIKEQTKTDENGKTVLKTAGDGMDSNVLQNPADPDATYRRKAGKEHIGYVANVVEAVDDQHNSITVDYQYEKNNYSDSQFLKDYIGRKSENSAPETLSTDGGYCGMENNKLAESKNIRLVTTDLKGADVSDHWADFEFNEDGTKVLLTTNLGDKLVINIENFIHNELTVFNPVVIIDSCFLYHIPSPCGIRSGCCENFLSFRSRMTFIIDTVTGIFRSTHCSLTDILFQGIDIVITTNVVCGIVFPSVCKADVYVI